MLTDQIFTEPPGESMRRIIVSAIVVAAFAALVASTALAATKTVSIKDNFYSPKSLTVKKNTTVKWVWRGAARHDVRVSKGPVKFNSTTKRSGSYSKKMTRKGTYSIYCSVHRSEMKMTLKVN